MLTKLYSAKNNINLVTNFSTNVEVKLWQQILQLYFLFEIEKAIRENDKKLRNFLIAPITLKNEEKKSMTKFFSTSYGIV